MLAYALQPASNSIPRFKASPLGIGDGGLTVTRTTYEDRDIASFSQKHQDQDDVSFISLQSIHGSVQATGEALVTPLAFPILNVVVNTAFPIPAALLGDPITNNCVKQVISDAEIITLGVGTGVTLGCELFGATTSTFPMGVGNDICIGLQNGQRDA